MFEQDLPRHEERLACRGYEVYVGHARVRVDGHSPQDVVERARQLLCLQLPRLWDVISRLELSRFHVRPL